MKKVFILLSCLLIVFTSYSQTLERNNAVRKNARTEIAENVKIQYIENEKHIRDTTNDALFRSINDGDIRISLPNPPKQEIESDNKKNKKNKKSKNASDKSINTFKRRFDSMIVKNTIHNYGSQFNEVYRSIDSFIDFNKELELNSLRSIESIRYYRSKLDSTKTVTSKKELTDSVVYLIAHLTILNNERERLFGQMLSSKNNVISITKKLQNGDTSGVDQLNDLIDNSNRYRNELHQKKTKLKEYDSTWNHFTEKYIKTAQAKPVEVAALPFFSTIPGLKDVNGSINVIGSSAPVNKKGTYIEFGLFTGVLKGADSSNVYNIFISEVSNYAFYFKSNFGFIQEGDSDTSKTKLGVNTAVFYANKPITKDSTLGIRDNFNSSLFHGKFGIEYVVYKNLFSTYFNGNAVTVVTNKRLFDQRFTPQTDLIGYADFGFKMLLNSSVKLPDGLKIYFDLNFLINTDELKKFNPASNDLLIPNFRVGLRANLGKI